MTILSTFWNIIMNMQHCPSVCHLWQNGYHKCLPALHRYRGEFQPIVSDHCMASCSRVLPMITVLTKQTSCDRPSWTSGRCRLSSDLDQHIITHRKLQQLQDLSHNTRNAWTKLQSIMLHYSFSWHKRKADMKYILLKLLMSRNCSIIHL